MNTKTKVNQGEVAQVSTRELFGTTKLKSETTKMESF